METKNWKTVYLYHSTFYNIDGYYPNMALEATKPDDEHTIHCALLDPNWYVMHGSIAPVHGIFHNPHNPHRINCHSVQSAIEHGLLRVLW